MKLQFSMFVCETWQVFENPAGLLEAEREEIRNEDKRLGARLRKCDIYDS